MNIRSDEQDPIYIWKRADFKIAGDLELILHCNENNHGITMFNFDIMDIFFFRYLMKLERDDNREEMKVFEGTPLLKSQTFNKGSNDEEFSSDNL